MSYYAGSTLSVAVPSRFHNLGRPFGGDIGAISGGVVAIVSVDTVESLWVGLLSTDYHLVGRIC